MTAIRVLQVHLSSVGQRLRTDSGQDLIEYAMLTALVVLVTLATVSSLGESIDGVPWQPLEPIVAQF